MRADHATPGTITAHHTTVQNIYGHNLDGTVTYLSTAVGPDHFIEIWPSDRDITAPDCGLTNRYDATDFPPADEYDPARCPSCREGDRHTHPEPGPAHPDQDA